MPAVDLVATWPAPHAAAGWVAAGGDASATDGAHWPFPLASVTKPLTAYAVLVALEEGSVTLDDEVGREVTLRHLLSHTSGLSFDGQDQIARPGTRRIYSNTGIERAADHVAGRTGIPFADYLAEAVLHPLGMAATSLGDRSPAAGAASTVTDLLRFGAELLRPTLVDAATMQEAITVQFPGLAGLVPGFGKMDPCDWGLGFELRDHKAPHWTGSRNSAATFGHFGGSGTFLWVDPVADVACVGLTDRDFDSWAKEAWPAFADAVIADHWADHLS